MTQPYVDIAKVEDLERRLQAHLDKAKPGHAIILTRAMVEGAVVCLRELVLRKR